MPKKGSFGDPKRNNPLAYKQKSQQILAKTIPPTYHNEHQNQHKASRENPPTDTPMIPPTSTINLQPEENIISCTDANEFDARKKCSILNNKSQ